MPAKRKSWIRRNLFANRTSGALTIALLVLAVLYLPPLLEWALFGAVFRTDADACQAARGTGACWGVIGEKWRLIVFGRYPYAEQWRPALATVLLLALLFASCLRRFWTVGLVPAWVAVWVAFFWLMGGGYGLTAVLRCDFVIAADDAQFGFPEVGLGVPTIVGAMRLPGRIGWSNAMELLLTGERVDAGTAAPLAQRATKEMAARGAHLPWEDAVRLGESMRRVVGASDDAAEGMRAARERRAPVWRGR